MSGYIDLDNTDFQNYSGGLTGKSLMGSSSSSLGGWSLANYQKRKLCEKQSQMGLSKWGKKGLFDKCMSQSSPLSLSSSNIGATSFGTKSKQAQEKQQQVAQIPTQPPTQAGIGGKKNNWVVYVGGAVMLGLLIWGVVEITKN